jgi:hypothetical protein
MRVRFPLSAPREKKICSLIDSDRFDGSEQTNKPSCVVQWSGFPPVTWEIAGSNPVTAAYCGVEQLVARRAHNPEVTGSNPVPATKLFQRGTRFVY